MDMNQKIWSKTPARPWTSTIGLGAPSHWDRQHVHRARIRGCIDGLRHDSGDPYIWGEKALAHYAKLRIDAHTKRLVFSDGLDIPRALAIYRHFGDRTQVGCGIGTQLTNDMGLEPLSIVMKLTHANGQPVAKISDSPGKTLCDNPTFLAYLRQVFDVSA